MSYFLIYGAEDGTKVYQFRDTEKLKEYLKEYWEDLQIEFLDCLLEDQTELYYHEFLIIKGKVVKPKPIEIVKTYEIE